MLIKNAIEFPDDLLRAFDHRSKQRVVAFVGSGPSCHAGLPSWSDLLRRIAVEAGLASEVEPHIQGGDFLEVAQYLAKERSEEYVQEKVVKHIKQASNDPGELHKLIVRLPFAGIITTNYDHLLTKADESRYFNPPSTSHTTKLHSQRYEPFLLHLHGHVGDPGTIVLTRHSYDEIETKRPKVRQFLSNIFQNFVVLFIGFGFSDDHVDGLLRGFKEVDAIGESTMFALIPLSSSQPNKVRHRSLQFRAINPIHVEDQGDHGVRALRDWLESLAKSIKQIERSYGRSVQLLRSSYLLDGLQQLFISDEYFPLLKNMLSELSNRPDLRNLVRLGLSERDVKELFSKLGLAEMRFILMALNKARRYPKLEDALSCFPPITEEPEF